MDQHIRYVIEITHFFRCNVNFAHALICDLFSESIVQTVKQQNKRYPQAKGVYLSISKLHSILVVYNHNHRSLYTSKFATAKIEYIDFGSTIYFAVDCSILLIYNEISTFFYFSRLSCLKY